ncbi:hypothetical protein [Hymenobacter cheonanensis]|uniref:hypothetical protein n=1 Tax=Hymenobacter sp. CA2-7 TaxID=3063993 RepID=UPI0027124CC1|nr:hypothetical protein [Hymenobacter sp. CA2-7]MDO7884233.1 hypothetical protein [Hymenobacter sp. CA2-7]
MKSSLISLEVNLLTTIAAQASWAQSPDSMRLQAFYQGQTGNCASVALIKAAIDRYGLGRVFDTTRTGTSVNIRLRNGQLLTITDAERRQAGQAAMFVRNDQSQPKPEGSDLPIAEATPIIQYANLCYAAMAKFIETYGEYGCLNRDNTTAEPTRAGNFQDALATLANGVCSDTIYRHLGLEVQNPLHAEFDPALDFTNSPGVLVYSPRHAVVLWRKYFDYHGDWVPRSNRGQCQTRRFKAQFYLVLK